jgi:hypothetical protein
MTPALSIPKSAALEPAALEPAALEPAALEPAALEPAALEPAALEPAALEPAALEPAALEPAALEPMAGRRAASRGSSRRPCRPVPAGRRGRAGTPTIRPGAPARAARAADTRGRGTARGLADAGRSERSCERGIDRCFGRPAGLGKFPEAAEVGAFAEPEALVGPGRRTLSAHPPHPLSRTRADPPLRRPRPPPARAGCWPRVRWPSGCSPRGGRAPARSPRPRPGTPDVQLSHTSRRPEAATRGMCPRESPSSCRCLAASHRHRRHSRPEPAGNTVDVGSNSTNDDSRIPTPNL